MCVPLGIAIACDFAGFLNCGLAIEIENHGRLGHRVREVVFSAKGELKPAQAGCLFWGG